MFVVFGANGNTGSVVASSLLDKGKRVRVVARDAGRVTTLTQKGAEYFKGDVEDATSVAGALACAEAAYMLVPPDIASEDFVGRGKRIADNYAKGLSAHKVPHGVLLSSVGAQLASGTGPIVTVHNAEQAFQKIAGTRFTFLRAAYFMENMLSYAHPIKTDGVLPVFGGGESYPFPMVATRDIGETAAQALLAAPAQTEWIELSGPKEYSFVDGAKEASAIVGREVKATPVPLDAMVPTLTKLGFSPSVAALFREMSEGFGSGRVTWEGKGKSLRGKVTLGDVLRGGLA